jgi:hypothetical protein
MSTRLRTHIRHNVVGYVAIVLFAIGGTAYATHPGGTNTISSGDIINGEVKTPDLGPDSVTATKILDGQVRSGDIGNNKVEGVDILESSLVGVNAAQVDGINAALIDHQTTGLTATPVEVLNMGGLILRLECVNTDFFEPKLIAATSVDDAVFRSREMPDFGTDEVRTDNDDDNFFSGPADEKTLYDSEQGSGLINYRTPAGTGVTVQYMVHGFGTSVGGCTVSGTAFQGDA